MEPFCAPLNPQCQKLYLSKKKKTFAIALKSVNLADIILLVILSLPTYFYWLYFSIILFALWPQQTREAGSILD